MSAATPSADPRRRPRWARWPAGTSPPPSATEPLRVASRSSPAVAAAGLDTLASTGTRAGCRCGSGPRTPPAFPGNRRAGDRRVGVRLPLPGVPRRDGERLEHGRRADRRQLGPGPEVRGPSPAQRMAPECSGATDLEMSDDHTQLWLPIRLFIDPGRSRRTSRPSRPAWRSPAIHELGHALGIFQHSPESRRHHVRRSRGRAAQRHATGGPPRPSTISPYPGAGSA